MEPIEAWAHAHLWTFAATFSWVALTMWLGLREQWRALESLLGGGIRENTRASGQEMPAESSELTPKQDPDDGLWYVPTFDPSTGRRSGKKAVDAPNLLGPRISSTNSARLGMFNR